MSKLPYPFLVDLQPLIRGPEQRRSREVVNSFKSCLFLVSGGNRLGSLKGAGKTERENSQGYNVNLDFSISNDMASRCVIVYTHALKNKAGTIHRATEQ